MSASTRTPLYYRFYCMDRADRISRATDSHCETDADAIRHGHRLLNDSDCDVIEVWNQGRKVGRVDRDGS
jgi:hypothetical protein